ncbi:uncharacterized protein At4g17910 isoform X2 [Gossypium hirsutum]|uniref:Uncharacterized protein At4g17910 isoform X2 n=1 Tax=Gossypium hirsutum TaxID=3635 RepID=A0ABM2ZVC6_GOSHI|nr:uncharacterized protein At4g17910-like isoform X2 [Gossypium hirsutum]
MVKPNPFIIVESTRFSAFDPSKVKNIVWLKALISCNKFTTAFSNSSSMDSFPRSLNPNKHLREQFVSNLPGSSMLEVSALLNNVALLMLLRHTFCSQTVNDACRSLKSYLASVALDYVFLVLPTLLIFTVLAEWVYICLIGLLLLLVFFTAVKRTYSLPYMEGPNASRASISSYRVVTMFITCLCILAVDFRIYPREYAKTETYGASLMDLGVGSFVLMNAVTSRQARNIKSSMSWWKAAFKSTTPLLLLGFARLASTLSLDYQVHVGEYGVNWNFFFTLAGVSILTSILNVPAEYSGILGSVILVGYQSWLTNGLNVYLLSNESLFGYWGMYLVGVQVSYYLFFENHTTKQRSKHETRIRICLLTIMFWILTLLIDRYVERISRRICNLAYVTWVVAQNLQLLALRLLADNIIGHKTLCLERAFDRNLLASFLVANLLTGLVNLSVDTIFVSPLSAVLILVSYSLTLCVVMVLIDFSGVKYKFW